MHLLIPSAEHALEINYNKTATVPIYIYINYIYKLF